MKIKHHPKTHSETLWHFTGGPTWNERKGCQNIKLKKIDDAFDALINIVKTKELRLGNYHEIIKCIIPEARVYLPKEKKITKQQ